MRFSDFINRLLHLRLNIREGYWLQFKLGCGDTFTVSIGSENYHGYKNSNVIFRKVLRNIDPEAAWNEIYGKCLANDYINNKPDLFRTHP